MTYADKIREEEGKIQHIQRLLLHPVKKHQPGDVDCLKGQIKEHRRLKARFFTIAEKQASELNLKLDLR